MDRSNCSPEKSECYQPETSFEMIMKCTQLVFAQINAINSIMLKSLFSQMLSCEPGQIVTSTLHILHAIVPICIVLVVVASYANLGKYA